MVERVVVVGAGVAGLAAARYLRARGIETVLIEADNQIGGRARTVQIGGAPFDLGATWFHDAGHNPLVELATPADALIDSDAVRKRRLSLAGIPATQAETAAFEAAWDRLDQVVAPTLAGPDITLAAAMAPMMTDPWAPLIARWEGATIAAADADQLGLQDWHRNRLEGRNMLPAHGLGTFVAKHLGTEAILSTPTNRIIWSGPHVQVETPGGTITADAAIITVSTGVLASGTIRFVPALPARVQAAIEALPMGLLSKIALPLRGDLGIAPNTLLTDRDGRMTFNVQPQGRRYLTGFVGGSLAWSVAHSPAAAEELAREELEKILGAAALTAIGPAAAISDWGTDPLQNGAYAYAGPGNAGQRGILAAAFPGERLLFAGEALRTDGLAGTVGGAYLSGTEAADRLMQLL